MTLAGAIVPGRGSQNEQQTMLGRYRASGAVLGATSLTAVPDYHADPHGKVTPLNAHIRLANPRTETTQDSRILRRGYNYDNGLDLAGDLDGACSSAEWLSVLLRPCSHRQ